MYFIPPQMSVLILCPYTFVVACLRHKSKPKVSNKEPSSSLIVALPLPTAAAQLRPAARFFRFQKLLLQQVSFVHCIKALH